MNMQEVTFSCAFFNTILCLHIGDSRFLCFILLHKSRRMNDTGWSDDIADLPQMNVSISVSNFDNSFADNCLSVHQSSACSGVGNLGHLEETCSTNRHPHSS